MKVGGSIGEISFLKMTHSQELKYSFGGQKEVLRHVKPRSRNVATEHFIPQLKPLSNILKSRGWGLEKSKLPWEQNFL